MLADDAAVQTKSPMLKRLAAYSWSRVGILSAVALVLLALSAYFFRYVPQTDTLEEAFVLMLAGGAVLLFALYLKARGTAEQSRGEPRSLVARPFHALTRVTEILLRQHTPTPAEIPLTPARANIPLVILGVGFIGLLTAINGNLTRIPELRGATIQAQFGLLLAGIAFIVWGLSGRGIKPHRYQPKDFHHHRQRLKPSGYRKAKPTKGAMRQHYGSMARYPLIGVRLKSPDFPEKELESLPMSLRPSPTDQTAAPFSRRTEYLALSTIFLLALAVRWWQVGTAVHHFVDEVHFSTAVLSFVRGDTSQKLLAPFSGITAFPWLFPYMQSWFVGVFGRNLEGLRAACVLIGALGVPALYLLARTLFGIRTALVAALLLATFPPHVQFSRIGLNNIVDPLFGTLMLAFLLRGLKFNRRLDFALAGAALGLTQYFYEGGRLLYPALFLLTLAALVIIWPGYLRRRWRGMLTTIIAALVIALPIYITLIALNEPLNARFQTVGIGGSYWLAVQQLGKPQTLEEHIAIPLLVYPHFPEIGLYYGGEQGMVLPYLVPFLMIGAFTLLFYWRSPGVIALLWVLLTSAGNMLMTEAAVYARYVVGFPGLTLLIAVGFQSIFWLIWPGRSRLRAAVMALLVVGMAVEGVRYYFGPHLHRYNQQLRQHYDSEDALFRSLDFPWGTHIHILSYNSPGDFYLASVLSYLADGYAVDTVPPNAVSEGYLAGLAGGVDHAFFIEPDDTLTLDSLRRFFSLEGPFTSLFDIEPERQLVLYYARYGGPPVG